jgi:hypothetical protein
MPNGPGIDRGDQLILELIHSGQIERIHQPKGPFTETKCRLAIQAPEGQLPEAAIQAIRAAVDDVSKRSAESISEWSHDFSRSWSDTPNGEELDIYTDLIPDDVYEERRQELLGLKKAYEDLFE